MGLVEYLPYAQDYNVREQVDRLFSRKMLGSVLVGKFTGDLAALTMTRTLGDYLGMTLGLVITIMLFIYWEKIERAAEGYSDIAKEYTVSERQSRLSDHNGFTDYQLDSEEN